MNSRRRNPYLVRKTYNSYVMVSILTSLTATVGILIDNIIAGHLLGQDALGAMGIVSPISLIFSALGNIAASGGTAKAARALGKGDQQQVNRVFSITVMFVLAAGFLLSLPGLLFPGQIAKALGAREALLPLSRDYIFGFFLGTIPTMMTTALMGFVKIDGSPRLPLISIAVMSFLNVVLDVVFVVVFHMGMFGMALATSVSYCAAVLVGLTHFLKPRHTLRLQRIRDPFQDLADILKTGMPTAVNRLCETGKTVILNVLLVSAVSVSAVAVLNVRTQMNNLLGAVTLGVGQAILPVAALFYGEEDRTALGFTLASAMKTGLVLNGIISLGLLIFPEFFPSLLGISDANTLQMARSAMILFALAMPLRGINMILMNYYQATDKLNWSMWVCVLESFLFTVLFSLILVKPCGSFGIWTAFLLAEILTFLTVVLKIFRKTGRFPYKVSHFLMLSQSFGTKERKVEFSIPARMESVMTVSEQLFSYCRQRHVHETLSRDLALCVEEIGGNIVRHGLGGNQKHWIDITLVNRSSEVLLSFRDSGAAFDPTSYEGSEEQTGIRLIRGISREFRYRRLLNMNVVVVVLRK